MRLLAFPQAFATLSSAPSSTPVTRTFAPALMSSPVTRQTLSSTRILPKPRSIGLVEEEFLADQAFARG